MEVTYYGVTAKGYSIYGSIIFDHEPTMIEIVNWFRDNGYSYFKVGNMRKLVKI